MMTFDGYKFLFVVKVASHRACNRLKELQMSICCECTNHSDMSSLYHCITHIDHNYVSILKDIIVGFEV